MKETREEEPFVYHTLVIGAGIQGIYAMANVPPEELHQWLCIDQQDK